MHWGGGILALLVVGCSSSSTGTSAVGGGTCTMTITGAAGSNNALQDLSAASISGDYSHSRTTLVCNTLTQALELTLMGPSPNLGVVYPISSVEIAGTDASATMKYGENTMSGGTSTHATWRGTGGNVKIGGAAKDTLSFTFSGVTTEVDPTSAQNLATGSFTMNGSGTVKDLLGYIPGR